MPKRKSKNIAGHVAHMDKSIARTIGASSMGISAEFETPTLFVVKATLKDSLPAEMPEELRQSMIMAVLSEALNLEAHRLAAELGKDDWTVTSHKVDSSEEQSH